MSDITITITSELREIIGAALDMAHSDQEGYLQYGDPSVDCGDEWPEAKEFKQRNFRGIAHFAELIGLHGEKERWESLADSLDEEETECLESA